LGACHRHDDKNGLASASASSSAHAKKPALTPELAGKPLAKVGERTITLGEYAATLERMDPFERLRYQSADRRKQLLDEMIEVELLAQEARKRGLDKDPRTQERLRQILRDELMATLKKDVPGPNDLPESEVKVYFESHKAEFDEPERRRVAVMALSSEAEAKKVAALAAKSSPDAWAKLVGRFNSGKKLRPGPPPPADLAGDLGIVGPPGDERSSNPRVPEPVRALLFKLEKSGDVSSEVASFDGQFYVVRMTGRTEARSRAYEEAERAIRVAMVQAKIREREAALEKELRQKFPIKIDEAALDKLVVPAASASVSTVPAVPVHAPSAKP
jgi:hypothetical protein